MLSVLLLPGDAAISNRRPAVTECLIYRESAHLANDSKKIMKGIIDLILTEPAFY
jgi:hypothetical protein